MVRARDGRGSDLAEHEGEDEELAPGRKTLTGQLGKPSVGKPPAAPGRRSLTLALPIRRALESEPGAPLPEPEKWSHRVGADVSGARLVTGPAAAEAATELQTRAFTVGNRVFFGSGFDATTDGGELLAHELTHVAQQKGATGSLDELPVLEHGDEREVAAREQRPGLASGLAIARDTAKPGPAKPGPAKPGEKPAPDNGAAMQQMAQGLPLITTRWKTAGLDLFTPAEKPQNVPQLADFETSCYTLLTQSIVDVDAVNIVLGGPNRGEYLKAFQRASQDFVRDRPLLDALKADVTNVLAGGQIQFNATQIMAHQSALSAHGRRALARPDHETTKKLIDYIAQHAFEHGEMESPTVQNQYYRREGGGKKRVSDCQALLKTLQTSAPPDVVVENKGPAQPSADAVKKAGEAAAAIDKLLAAAGKRHGELMPVEIAQLTKALETAGPEAREVLWGNKAQVAKVVQLLNPTSARQFIEALDPIEALYKKCEAVHGDDEESKGKTAILTGNQMLGNLPEEARELAMKGIKLKAGGSVYTALHEFLLAHLADQPMRMRLLQHTKLKNVYIDRLAADNSRVIYRMIVRGSETPTPEDMVHEAAEKHQGAEVVRGLRALAGNDPVRLAALEKDPVFRQLIEKLTDEVNVDGNIVRPYQLCMTMWGHQVGVNEDPNAISRIETNPGADKLPLTIPERVKLNRELFDPCLDELWDEIGGAHYTRKVKQANDDHDVIKMQQLGYDAMGKRTADPQVVRDVLVKYDHLAQSDKYQPLLQRDHVMWAAELEKRFYQKYSQDLRAWIYEKSGPVNRTGAMRVLGLEQGAGVGMVNGQVVGAGEASVKDKVTIEQALRETTRDGQPLAEIASIESRTARSAIDDKNSGAFLGAFVHLEASVNMNADALFKLTGVHVRPIDLFRNAFMLHSGHLETRLRQKWQGQELADINRVLGLTDTVDKVEGAPPPSLEEQAQQLFAKPAQDLWDCISLIRDGAMSMTFGPARSAWDTARGLPVLELPKADPKKPDPKLATVAPSVASGVAGHDIEERPPRTFNGYYQLHYGVSPMLHTAAAVKALGKQTTVSTEQAASLLGIPAADLDAWTKMATQQLAAPSEKVEIGPHNQHLVRASFTVEVATKNAAAMWDILHTDGKLQLIETELYGPYNDEEQRLIRIAFRQLSGGFDLTFYIRQAMEERRRVLNDKPGTGSQILSGLGGTAGGEAYIRQEKAKQQAFMIGGEGTEKGDMGMFSAVRTMGDDAELDRALAISTKGEVDARTRVRNAVQRKEDSQVLRIIDDLEPAERKQVYADGELMTALNAELSQQNYDRVFKVLTGQADLADRMLSRTIGNTWWKKHISGKPDQEGMKEDVRTYIRQLRLQIDKQVRAEAVERLNGQQPTNEDVKAIDQEVIKRLEAACRGIEADPTQKQVMDDVLNEEDKAEIHSIQSHAGEAKDFALVAGKSAAEIIAEIHGMKPQERQDKLADPAYMQMLGQKLTSEKDYRDALNALNQIGQGPDNLSSLDKKSRGEEQTHGSDRDPRETLRALAKLSPEELEHLKSDPAMQAQIMAALDDPKHRELARQLLGGPTVAVDPKLTGDEKVKAEEEKKFAFVVQQSVYRLRVACRTSDKWSVVLEEAIEVYKAKLETLDDPGKKPMTPKPTDVIAKPQNLRQEVWRQVHDDVTGFANEHDRTRKGKELTTDDISGQEMIKIIQEAVLRTQDPSDWLVRAKIYTVDEQLKGQDPDVAKQLKQFGMDDKYKEEDLVAAIQSASDEHLAKSWTSVVAPPVGGGPTMKQTYEDFQQSFDLAKKKIAAEEEAKKQAQLKEAHARAVKAKAAQAPAHGDGAQPAPAGPQPEAEGEKELDWSKNVQQTYNADKDIAAAELKRKQFLEYTIKVSEGFEEILRPHMGDNREKTKRTAGYEPQLSGTGNKRYDVMKETLLARIPQMSPDAIARAIGIQPVDLWLIKDAETGGASATREEIGMFNLRHEKNLRSRGRNTSERSVASEEKQELDTSRVRYGREMAKALTKGPIDATEKEKLGNLGDENDRARDAYKTALETTAMWASLIIGTLVTIIATILTGGLALGPVAAMAIGAATAALSATAKAWVNRQILDTEFDSKDATEMVTQEVLTSVMTIGTTFFAQKLLSAVSGLSTVAKQANAARQVLQTPPPIWRVFLNQATESVTQSAMSTVVEAGLEYTDPMHFIDGYREGEKEAKAAAMEKLKAAPKEAMRGAVTSLLIAGMGKMLRPKGGGHVEFTEAAQGKRRVDITRNLKKVFGDPENKIAGAAVEWAMNQSDPIDWSKAPAELFAGTVRQYNNAAADMHGTTAAIGSRGARARVSMSLYEHQMTLPEREAYIHMTAQAGSTDTFVSAKDYVAIRSNMAMTGLQVWEGQHPNVKLTEPQREAFVKWVREAKDADGLSERAQRDPTTVEDVQKAIAIKPPKPVVEEHPKAPEDPNAEADPKKKQQGHEEEEGKPHAKMPGGGAHPGGQQPGAGGERTAQEIFGQHNPNPGEVWLFKSESGNVYPGRYAGVDDYGRIAIYTHLGLAYLEPSKLTPASARKGIPGLHDLPPTEHLTLVSKRGNPRTGHVEGFDEHGNVKFRRDTGELEVLLPHEIDLARTQRDVQEKGPQLHVVEEHEGNKVVPIVHAGADADGHIALATRLGVMPNEVVKVGKATIKVGQLFDAGDGRIGVLLEVEVNGTKYMRVAYRSNSQGSFRLLPAVNDTKKVGHLGAAEYDKSAGEHSLMLPSEVEEVLARNLMAGKVVRGHTAEEGAKVLEGAVPPKNTDVMQYLDYDKSPDNVKNSVKQEVITAKAENTVRDSDGKKHATPGEVKISEHSQRPNFKQLVRSYTTTTSLAGEVTALVFRSHDNTLEFVVFKDKTDHIWFSKVSKVNSEITSHGVAATAINTGDLTMPLWEYPQQIPGGFKGETHSQDPHYANAWKYLREMPEVRAFYEQTGTAMPDVEHAQKPATPAKPPVQHEPLPPHVQPVAQGKPPLRPAQSHAELFHGENPVQGELWTIQSGSDKFYKVRFYGYDAQGNMVVQVPSGEIQTMRTANLVSARRGASHPDLHQYGPNDVITLYSVRDNPHTGTILGYDEAGRVIFKPVQGPVELIPVENLKLANTKPGFPGAQPQQPQRPEQPQQPSDRPTQPMEAVDPNRLPAEQPRPAVDPSHHGAPEHAGPQQQQQPETQRNIHEDHPAIQHLGELPREVMIGPHQRGLVEPALRRLSDPDYQRFRQVEASVHDPVGRGFLYKAMAAGNSVEDAAWLAQQMAGKDSNWLVDNLTLGDPRGVGAGIKQQWATSCNAAMVLTLRGNSDPVFALRLHEANTAVGSVNEHDPHALNTNQAALEQQMLQSQYAGQNPLSPAGHQGVAQPRATGAGVGRFADDLLNQISATTGMTYRSETHPSGTRVIHVLERSLRQNQQVPLVVGSNAEAQQHYVLVQGRKVENGVIQYNIRDPWDGTTHWVRATDVEAGRLPGGWQKIGTIEVPASLPEAAPANQQGPQHPGPAHDQGPTRPSVSPDPVAAQRPTVRIDAPVVDPVAIARAQQPTPQVVEQAPRIAETALGALTQRATGPDAEQVITHQLEQLQPPVAHDAQANAGQHEQGAPKPQAEPQVSAAVQNAVAQQVHSQALMAEIAIVEAVQEGKVPKGHEHDPKRQEFTKSWKDKHVDIAEFLRQFDLEAEDAQTVINRAMAKPHLAAVLSRVPNEELVAIILYTSTHFVEWNRTLREADTESAKEVGSGIALADKGLSKLPVHEGWVYRGTSLDADKLAKYVPGEEVTEEAFTSTAYEHQGTENYKGNVEFKIKSKTGRSVSGLSRYENEKEILFRPGTKFKVVDKERVGDRTIVTLEEEGAGGGGHKPGGPNEQRDQRDQSTTEARSSQRRPTGGQFNPGEDRTEDLLHDQRPSSEVRKLQEDARRLHPGDENGQKNYIWKQLQKDELRQSLLSHRDSELPIVAQALEAHGIANITEQMVGKVFDYVFNSAGLAFHYPNYQAWFRLASGQATVSDLRWFIHESTEISIMAKSGVDYMGTGLRPNTQRHGKWFKSEFMPAYESAHGQALHTEYEFLANRLAVITGESHRVSAEVVAAIDPVSPEGRENMIMPDGRKLAEVAELGAWKARAQELVKLGPDIAARIGAPEELPLGELVRILRESPASLENPANVTSRGPTIAGPRGGGGGGPGGSNLGNRQSGSTKEAMDSLNTEGSFEFRIQRIKQLREDIKTGSQVQLSPDVPPDAIERVRKHIEALTDEELVAIQGYSTQDYKAINRVLRDPNADPIKTAHMAGYIEAVRSGLSKLPNFEGEAYRGTALSSANWRVVQDAFEKGTPLADAAFSSSSESRDVAEDFLRKTRGDGKIPVFFTIQSRGGKQIEFLSKTANEVEVLFGAGVKFKVIDIGEAVGPDGQPRKEVFLREMAPES